MNEPLSDLRVRLLRIAFRMPSVQTMVSRKSSITNAFVNSLIPVIEPTPKEIAGALQILGMEVDDVRCAYCGDKSTEWDHLRPLVVNRRPTGYISEIANLVPACGKCNQSKGNKPWIVWMRGKARHSPASRKIHDISERIARLQAYENSQQVSPVPFEDIVGSALYAEYWSRLEKSIEYLRECHAFASALREKIAIAHGRIVRPKKSAVQES